MGGGGGSVLNKALKENAERVDEKWERSVILKTKTDSR